MNYDDAIDRWRPHLIAIVASLYAMIGLTEGGSIDRIKKPIYRAVLALLKPAEAAVRRLIIIAAQGIVVEPPAADAAAKRPARSRKGKPRGKRRRQFALCDPEPRAGAGIRHIPNLKAPRAEPRVRSTDDDPLEPWLLRPAPPVPPPAPKPQSDGTVGASSLCRRLEAIMDALNDLPRQARRYARWRDKPIERRRPQLYTALRYGPPPGLREKSKHEVHAILKACHLLADNLPEPDTS